MLRKRFLFHLMSLKKFALDVYDVIFNMQAEESQKLRLFTKYIFRLLIMQLSNMHFQSMQLSRLFCNSNSASQNDGFLRFFQNDGFFLWPCGCID
jgi:hypothetical protein